MFIEISDGARVKLERKGSSGFQGQIWAPMLGAGSKSPKTDSYFAKSLWKPSQSMYFRIKDYSKARFYNSMHKNTPIFSTSFLLLFSTLRCVLTPAIATRMLLLVVIFFFNNCRPADPHVSRAIKIIVYSNSQLHQVQGLFLKTQSQSLVRTAE